jgi:RHS repeat-associated protein
VSCVNVTIGLVNLEDTDFSFPGFIPFSLTRSYRSTSSFQGPFGHAWASNLSEHLAVQEDAIVLTHAEGRTIRLPRPTDHQPVVSTVEGLALTVDRVVSGNQSALALRVRRGPRVTVYADPEGRGRFVPTAIEDRHRNTIQFQYRAGRLSGVIDTLGRRFAFVSEARGRVTDIYLATGATSADNTQLAHYDYDAAGDLVAVSKHSGAVNEYEYDDHLLVRYRDDQGVVYYHQYDRERRCVRTWRGAGRMVRHYFYDPQRRQTRTVDSVGASRLYRYNEFNLITETVDPLNGVSFFAHDAANKVMAAVNQSGAATILTYDDKQQLVAKTRADGSTVQFVRDAQGNLVQHVNEMGGISAATYDERGDLVSATTPSGSRTTFEYDDRGGTVALVLPNGLRVRRDYGWDHIRFSADDGLIVESRFDLFGRCRSVEYSGNRRVVYEYDERGRLVRETGIGGATREFGYDDAGRVTRYVDHHGAVTTYTYDDLGRRTGITSEERYVAFAWDPEGRLTGVVNAKGETHSVEYDLKGQMRRQTFFDGRTEHYEYDACGAIRRIGSASGWKIAYEGDAQGRPTRARLADGTAMEFTYAPNGKIARAVRDGYIVAFEYDAEGRIVAQQQGDFELRYAYDAMGRPARVEDSDGVVCRYEYDLRLRATRLVIDGAIGRETGNPLVIDLGYDEVDAVRSVALSGGPGLRRTNNIWGRPLQQVLVGRAAAAVEEWRYDQAAQVVGHRARDGRELTYVYDRRGELVAVHESGQEREWYAYDAEFNVLAKRLRRAEGLVATSFEYARGNRLVRAGDTQYRYDEAGRISSITRGTEVTMLAYSDDDLLRRVRHPDGTVTEYDYDALRRRIAKRRGDEETRFIWDRQILWREQTCRREADVVLDTPWTAHFVYEPAAWGLLALSNRRGTFLAVNDPIGAPHALYEAGGGLAWEAVRSAWGESLDVGPAGDGARLCPIRFPGQYADVETGLVYNLNRYYEPSSARYVSPDPLGLIAGLNVYAYAIDPLNHMDPLGLQCQNFKPGEPPTLYRGDDRDPKEICANGFQPKNAAANISIKDHVGGDTRSWVSTSYDVNTAARFGAFVYIIDNPGCGVEVDCDPELQAFEEEQEKKYGVPKAASESEFAFKNIVPTAVTGYWENTPSGWVQQSC